MGYDSGSRTGTTLWLLLNDPTNDRAWAGFVDRYGPKIHSWCRRWRLQEADAENVTQEVLIKLARKIHQYKPGKGSFRGWLKTVTHHAWSDYLDSQKHGDAGRGDTAFLQKLQTIEARDDLVESLENEFDREILEEAMARVKVKVEAKTWEIFQQLALQGKSGAEVAAALDMKVAAVFVSRSRVQKLLQKEIRLLEDQTSIDA